MMKKKLIRGLVSTMVITALAFSLAGCGDSESSATTAATSNAASQSTEAQTGLPVTDPISFVKSGEIYFDLQLGDGVSVSLDGQKLSGNTASFKSGATVTIDGLDENGSSSYFVIYSTKDNTGAHFEFFSGKGAKNTKLSEILTKKLNFNADKVFVSLFESGKTWDKNLSDDLNNYINNKGGF